MRSNNANLWNSVLLFFNLYLRMEHTDHQRYQRCPNFYKMISEYTSFYILSVFSLFSVVLYCFSSEPLPIE